MRYSIVPVKIGNFLGRSAGFSQKVLTPDMHRLCLQDWGCRLTLVLLPGCQWKTLRFGDEMPSRRTRTSWCVAIPYSAGS